MSCKNVLIVEDAIAINKMMKDILEHYGYRVTSAHNGEEGIKKLHSLNPQPCVVILDLMMPVKNGWEFLDIQRNDPRLAGIPVVICSAYPESAIAARPSAFLPKPIQLHSLLETVRVFC